MLPRWRAGIEAVAFNPVLRGPLLPRSLTTRLANHARPSDVTEGYAADWTVARLRERALRIADRIDELSLPSPMDTAVSS